MEYKYCENKNFEDFASGRVIYGNAGIPNFPVRLLNEMFGRSLQYIEEKKNLTIFDPCCGGGYLLTVLGLCNQEYIKKVIGSDIDTKMLSHARKNLDLLTSEGLKQRIGEIQKYIGLYGKESHYEAIESAKKLRDMLHKDMTISIFEADCTKEINIIEKISLIITDIPYGNLVSWQGCESNALNVMLDRLADISDKNTILALAMDKRQKYESLRWKRLESQNIGKRKFVIMKLEL